MPLERAIMGWGRLAMLAWVSLGCSSDPEPAAAETDARSWVGQVQGSDVKVGLVGRGSSVALFFCGGAESYATDTHWFLESTSLEESFSFDDGGWSVAGAFKDASSSGDLQTPSHEASRPWSAAATAPATLAGLYEGTAPCGKLGLIVTQARADDEPSGQGACLRVEGDTTIVEQVNPVRLEASVSRELEVTVASAPDERFTVRPVANVEQ